MNKTDKIYVAGHNGLVGSALLKKLKKEGFINSLTRTSQELDLTKQKDTEDFFKKEEPDYVFLTAGKSGGIVANDKYPVDLIYPNLLIECNVLQSARETKVKKLLLLACGCVYPRDCPQPMKEEYLLSGKPEPTNLPHAVAKIAGIVMCQSYNRQYNTDFISCISANVFGPNDNFDLESGHVVPSLIKKFHTAKIKNEPAVTIWGTGKPLRDFIYVDDLADACLFLMHNYDSSEPINISAGINISIGELAEVIKVIVGYEGEIKFDLTKPNGMPNKLLDNTEIKSLGWQPKVSLKKGLEETYRWYLNFKGKSNR